jgi:tRNA-Thr(GGU) m(6)t(6)A37 methyltransferase TsaA
MVRAADAAPVPAVDALRDAGREGDAVAMPSLVLSPIGVIRTPFERPEGTPIQPSRAAGARGTVEVLPEFADGLADLDGFSHIIVLYAFHASEGFTLRVIPFLDVQPRGVFATRAPRRPNPIGVSVLELRGIHGSILEVANVDIIDGTPLLDIKPYVPQFDCGSNVRIGWLTGKSHIEGAGLADDRFTC